MANEFKNKNEFKEEFQRRIIERYGRSFEQAHITEKYMILGEMVRDYASVHWNASKNCLLYTSLYNSKSQGIPYGWQCLNRAT